MTWHGLSWGEALDLTMPQAEAILTGGKSESEASPAEVEAWKRQLRERRAANSLRQASTSTGI